MFVYFRATLALLVVAAGLGAGAPSSALAMSAEASVRAAIPRAAGAIEMDGRLTSGEYAAALATPVEYFHRDAVNRAGQFYYLWDHEAFYVALRTLDQNAYSPESPLWEGDAVEWYFDARRGPGFLSRSWPAGADAGAVHCFFTAMRLNQLEPRFTLRPGFERAIRKEGVEVAAQRTAVGLEVEFKLPWRNFPGFQPGAGEIIGIDAELSYSDGGERSDRTFVFGSPLSVQQPANLARVELVDKFARVHWKQSGAVMMPLRVDMPWNQSEEPQVVARIALPPNRRADVGKVEVRVFDLHDRVLGAFTADNEIRLAEGGDFALLEARWPAALAPAGGYRVHAVVLDRDGNELTRIAPRMVSVNMTQGY